MKKIYDAIKQKISSLFGLPLVKRKARLKTPVNKLISSCENCGWEDRYDKAENTENGDFCPRCLNSILRYDI